MKYLVKLRFEIEGVVDKPDVIGAIFGQTENLFGNQFDLRELQDKGRIGRIQVEIKHQGNKTIGELQIPSNLDRSETALLVSMVEAVEKVGPYNSKFMLQEIEDIRAEKLKLIVNRAKEILRSWSKEKTPDLKEILNEISTAVKVAEIISYGPEELPAGPDVEKDPSLILVEGRADVINMLKYGYRNVIAIGGAKGTISPTITKLSKEKKTVIAFLDGDHGGDLILRELINNGVKIDYVARAPQGKEVEELTGKEILKSLSNMVPVQQVLKKLEVTKQEQVQAVKEEKVIEEKIKAETIEIPKEVLEEIKKLPGSLEGILFDDKWNTVDRVQVREIYDKLNSLNGANVAFIAFDGVVTQRLLDIAQTKGIKLILGARIGGINYKPESLHIITFSELL
jgi:DNA primase